MRYAEHYPWLGKRKYQQYGRQSLFKADGMQPTIANVVDDHLMAFSVIRGEEWLFHPLHVMLYEAFGWNCPAFSPSFII